MDHTRDFFTGSRFSREDLAHTFGPFFFGAGTMEQSLLSPLSMGQ